MSSVAPSTDAPYWDPYRPDLANRLLDEIGLKRDRSGMRTFPNSRGAIDRYVGRSAG